jgi:hypothetical protein
VAYQNELMELAKIEAQLFVGLRGSLLARLSIQPIL